MDSRNGLVSLQVHRRFLFDFFLRRVTSLSKVTSHRSNSLLRLCIRYFLRVSTDGRGAIPSRSLCAQISIRASGRGFLSAEVEKKCDTQGSWWKLRHHSAINYIHRELCQRKSLVLRQSLFYFIFCHVFDEFCCRQIRRSRQARFRCFR